MFAGTGTPSKTINAVLSPVSERLPRKTIRGEALTESAQQAIDIIASKVSHKEVGLTASKYMETLQRSNEQLVKVIAIMKREKTKSESVDISEQEVDEILDIIKG